MFIEDLLHKLQLNCVVNRYDTGLVNSFLSQIFSGHGFTEKQSIVAVKIIKRYSKNLSAALNVDILPFLANPTFKNQLRKNNTAKKISIVEDQILNQVIKVEFPYDVKKVDSIRQHRAESTYVQWDSQRKAWIFSLDERNIQFLMSFISDDTFEFDDQFRNYMEQAKKIIASMENYVPILTCRDGFPSYCNVSPTVPKMQSTDIIAAIFEARKAGIFTWDESVSKSLNSKNINYVTRRLLSSEHAQFIDVDSNEHPIDCLVDIVKYSNPTLFIIPNGDETEKTRLIYDFLTKIGVKSQEISVMFRLSNNVNKTFNEFVKDNGLNNPITETTKFVFVSGKMPKPVIKSSIRFSSIVSLQKSNVHYTIHEFLKKGENLIFYYESKKQREFTFGDL